MDTVRIDKYLWAVRIFKTRSEAAEAVRGNRVSVNGSNIKPSREVKAGDTISVRRAMVTYTYRVVEPVAARQPAKSLWSCACVKCATVAAVIAQPCLLIRSQAPGQ